MARGDGKLYITFVQMGQGDCALIRLPNGKTLMIDCGSDRYDILKNNTNHLKQIQDTVFSDTFFKNDKVLDTLIMTHTDTDHHNKIDTLFNKYPGTNYVQSLLTIKKVYHSNDIANYYKTGTSSFIKTAVSDYLIKAIDFNSTKGSPQISDCFDNTKNDIVKQGNTPLEKLDFTDAEFVDKRGFVLVMDGTYDHNDKKCPKCTVSIIASNVNEYNKKAMINDGYTNLEGKVIGSKANSASIVTMIEIGNETVMICADATMHTEKFLVERYGKEISNITLLQIPHHGSRRTSSTSKFVDLVDPLQVVISAATKESSHYLPSGPIIKKYLNGTRILKGNPGKSYYWIEYDDPDDNDEKELDNVPGFTKTYYYMENSSIKKDLKITGSHGNIDIVHTP